MNEKRTGVCRPAVLCRPIRTNDYATAVVYFPYYAMAYKRHLDGSPRETDYRLSSCVMCASMHKANLLTSNKTERHLPCESSIIGYMSIYFWYSFGPCTVMSR